MITDTENSDMPDRMSIWTTIAGYGMAAAILILIFVLAAPVGD